MQDFFDLLGIKASVLAAGLFGGVLRALSHRHYKLREMFASPVCGAIAAAYLTMPTVYYLRSINWPLPDDPAATHATAFLIGVCAMWISDIAFDVLIRRLKGEARPPSV